MQIEQLPARSHVSVIAKGLSVEGEEEGEG
jgi:hypothetical protein